MATIQGLASKRVLNQFVISKLQEICNMIDKLYSVFMQRRVLICSCSCLEKLFHTKCEEPGMILYLCVCRSIMTDLYYLSQADGVGEWRMKEAKDLSDLVQNRITYLQVSAHTPAVCTDNHCAFCDIFHTFLSHLHQP